MYAGDSVSFKNFCRALAEVQNILGGSNPSGYAPDVGVM
jgi:hypothetical protein